MRPRWRQDGPRWSQDGTRWVKMRQDGPTCSRDAAKMGQDGTKTEPRRAISPSCLQCFFAIPGCRPECAKKWPRNDKDGAKIGQDGAKMGQDAAKTRENESQKCGHSRQIRCFCKVGTIQRQRRAKNVRMKQVLDRGRTDRREKEPKCGHCRGPKRRGWRRWAPKWVPSGGQDGLRWG